MEWTRGNGRNGDLGRMRDRIPFRRGLFDGSTEVDAGPLDEMVEKSGGHKAGCECDCHRCDGHARRQDSAEKDFRKERHEGHSDYKVNEVEAV